MAERVERQLAYVLHQRAYRETSAILELFTRDHGRVAVVARGLRAAKPRFSRGNLRALQPIECAWLHQGELGQLTAAEAAGLPLVLNGSRLQSALYLNELLVRMLQRHDPQAALFEAYARLLPQLSANANALGFQLRRFEMQLLSELGYGIDFAVDTSTQMPVVPRGRYRVMPEHGVISARHLEVDTISGAALLALSSGEQPDPVALRELRRMMRALLLHHLGGRGLNAWRVLRSPVPPSDRA
ncbi:MAG: DNA repair protein RecO [Rhodanobacteraceae bacterium]|nr:DNA repair protein RecO [Rhodanobacteraceae bacterium]MBL0041394.1 DNA repair protein RecO [Xanthomonadales bacterium]MBP6077394.1 DNA repair protein RecO [Xanthomonadales bacterium]MBP7622464.1 DNA repair protein RecO [Xanthomonadales bacterium]